MPYSAAWRDKYNKRVASVADALGTHRIVFLQGLAEFYPESPGEASSDEQVGKAPSLPPSSPRTLPLLTPDRRAGSDVATVGCRVVERPRG